MTNTIHIEDFILTLANVKIAKCNNWDQTLIYSFADQINRTLGFTEKQANLAGKIIRKHIAALSNYYHKDITPYVNNPTYRYPIRTVLTVKRISIIEHPIWFKVIKAEFPYNEKLVYEIKNRVKPFYATWDKELRAWIFSLSEKSIKFVNELFSKEEFIYDQEFENYCQQIRNIEENLEKYVPMLVLDQNGPKFSNFDSNLPNLESKDPVFAIFEARKRGISVWDNSIEQHLKNSSLQQITKEFLKTDPSKNFEINSDEFPIECLQDFIKFMNPCLIIIPGGSELEKLQQAHSLLKNCGIEDNEVSVMFRLPSNTDKDFNLYVRDNNLNNPISNEIKIVFVSSKLTKPLIKSNINFNCVINLGHGNVHYTMRDFVQKRENLIYYCIKSSPQQMLILSDLIQINII